MRLPAGTALLGLLLTLLLLAPSFPLRGDSSGPQPQTQIPESVSGQTRACLECHIARGITASAVRDWQLSAHYELEVGCADCHLPAESVPAAIQQMPTTCEDKRVRRAVSPRNCVACHAAQAEQFAGGKHALAWVAMTSMPTTGQQPSPIVAGEKGCGGCHRIGRDEGKCDSCHTRHLFSAAEARRPEACMTCHMGFDHPQWEMYSTSKHGTIYRIQGEGWDWRIKLADWFKQPYTADLRRARAPVCATCHMPAGDHAVRTAWGFLALRLGEKDPEWLKYREKILMALGVLTPEGQPTPRFEVVQVGQVARLTPEEWAVERARMLAVCSQCHAASFAGDQMRLADEIIKESDKLLAEAINIVEGLYRDGILARPAERPPHPDLLRFYEVEHPIEQKLYVMFLEHRMRSFQGAFHMNPDYMHWYGWAELKRDLVEIRREAEQLRAAHGR